MLAWKKHLPIILLCAALAGGIWLTQQSSRSPNRKEINESGLVIYSSDRTSEYAEEYEEAAKLLADGKPSMAEAIYQNLRKKEPNQQDPLIGISACRIQSLDYRGAIEICEQAIQLDSNALDPFISMGSAYYGIGAMDKAIKYYESALEFDQNSPDAHWGLALAHHGKANLQQAQLHLARFRELAPNSRHLPYLKEMIGKE